MALNDWRSWPRNSGRRSACATSSIGFPTRRAPRSKTGKPAWHLLPDLKNPHRRPTCHPDSCGCVSWSATIDDWLRIAAKGRPACAICIRKRKARPPSAPCSAQVLPNWQSLLRAPADRTSFACAYQVYACLRAIGILAAVLSNPPTRDRRGVEAGVGRVETLSLRGQAGRSWPGLRPAMRIGARSHISAR